MALCDCEVLQCQGRSKENLCVCLTLAQSFHMLRSSCATYDFWGGKVYTKIFNYVFQTSSRLCEFGTNFKNMFYSFWYFTLVAEPVRMKDIE